VGQLGEESCMKVGMRFHQIALVSGDKRIIPVALNFIFVFSKIARLAAAGLC
jgi:hypothetical protein